MNTERIKAAAALLRTAEKPVRVLRAIEWPSAVRERFLAAGGREMPVVEYAVPDVSSVWEPLAEARKLIEPEGAVDDWLRRTADAIESAAHMLGALGTPQFYTHARRLYGAPTDTLPDGLSHALDLATRLREVLDGLTRADLGAPPVACHLASALAAEMKEAVQAMFGDAAPQVEIVDDLSANALAGPRRIRVRKSACFSDRDMQQLIHHEAGIHVATSLNGLAQTELPILGAGHPGTTRTQEGLAVFAEFITGSMDSDRLRRLSDRVVGIQMAIDGADFLEVYRYFLERTHYEEAAFEGARRVFRGGVLAGGAPFPKDSVYLGGLVRVHEFMRAAASMQRVDAIRLLFCGKLDLEDVPALCALRAAGLCQEPRFLPEWARDLRFLVSHLAYSSFLGSVDQAAINEHYREALSAPIADSV